MHVFQTTKGEGLEPESVGTASLCEKGERCVKEECELFIKKLELRFIELHGERRLRRRGDSDRRVRSRLGMDTQTQGAGLSG